VSVTVRLKNLGYEVTESASGVGVFGGVWVGWIFLRADVGGSEAAADYRVCQ
jgi:hypothetical protein